MNRVLRYALVCLAGMTACSPEAPLPDAEPVITHFAADPAVVAPGDTASLVADFANGAGVVDNGIGAVQSGVPVSTPKLTAATTFTLTVTNKAGKTVTQTVTVEVKPGAPTISRFTAMPETVNSGGTVSLTAEFSNGAGGVDNGIGAIQSGVPVTSPALTADTTFTLTVTGSDGQTATRSVTVHVAERPTIARFTASADKVTRGSSVKLTAEFTGGEGAIDHGVGAIQSGATIDSPGLDTTTTFTLTVTSPTGSTASLGVTITVLDAPAITRFDAAADPIIRGSSASITAEFTGGTGAIDHGIGAIQSGVTVTTLALEADTTFTLTVTSPVGAQATRTLTVHALPAPSITSFTAAASTLRSGQATTLTAVFADGTGVIDHGMGAVQSGVAIPTPALTQSTTFTLTVTNAAGAQNTAQVTIAIEGKPLISAFSAAHDPVTVGKSASLSASFTGGTGSLDQGIGAIQSGVPVTTPALTADTVFTLTVTTPLGETTTRTLTVHAVPAPTITSFSGPSIVTTGETACLQAVFGDGTGTVDQAVGAIASGGSACSGALSASTTFTLTVTNPAGDSVTRSHSVEVVPAPEIQSFDSAAPLITTANTTTLLAVFSGGHGTITPDVGAVQSGVAATTPPLSAQTTFTLTVTNPAGKSVTRQTTVAVVPPAVIDAFTVDSGAAKTITLGDSVTLAYSFHDGSGAIDQGVGAVQSGGTTSVTPSGTTTYQLVVQNAAGQSATATVVVTVVDPPVITSFVTNGHAQYQLTNGFRAVFTGGTGRLQDLTGGTFDEPITSGISNAHMLTQTTTVRLTVTNAAGRQAIQELLVPYDYKWQRAENMGEGSYADMGRVGGLGPKLFVVGLSSTRSLFYRTARTFESVFDPSPLLPPAPSGSQVTDVMVSGPTLAWMQRTAPGAAGTLVRMGGVISTSALQASIASLGTEAILGWTEGNPANGLAIGGGAATTTFESQSGAVAAHAVGLGATGAVVTWISGTDLWAARRPSGSGTWGAAVAIASGTVSQPLIGVDQTGTAHIAWLQDSTLKWRSLAANGTLSPVTTLSSASPVAPSLSVSAAGNAVLGWSDATGSAFSCYRPANGWTSSTSQAGASVATSMDEFGGGIVVTLSGTTLLAGHLDANCQVTTSSFGDSTTKTQPKVYTWRQMSIVVWTQPNCSGTYPCVKAARYL